MRALVYVTAALIAVAAPGSSARAQETAAAPAGAGAGADLAKQLANPIASLISLPFQFNFDGKVGPDKDGERVTLNIQPVVPISLNPRWNLISRTILPVVWQTDIFPGAGSQFGLGDTVQSLFFSPAVPKGAIWGVGPVFLLPTGTDDLLSGKKWGTGFTGVVLKQMGPVTVGLLANHIWSFAGADSRGDISQSYMNPFASYVTRKQTTFSLLADITCDWKGDTLVVPLTGAVSQLVVIGKRPVSIGGAVRYYVATSDSSPHGVAGRIVVTLLFPKKPG